MTTGWKSAKYFIDVQLITLSNILFSLRLLTPKGKSVPRVFFKTAKLFLCFGDLPDVEFFYENLKKIYEYMNMSTNVKTGN